MANHSKYSCCEDPMNCTKRQKDKTTKDELHPPRSPPPLGSESVQYATGEYWRAITNSSRKNKASWPKHKLCSVMDVSGGESKV